jgi:hypothetical protein
MGAYGRIVLLNYAYPFFRTIMDKPTPSRCPYVLDPIRAGIPCDQPSLSLIA